MDIVQDEEKKADAVLAAETSTAKKWLAANREEATILICVSLAVGLLIGALIGFIMRGPHL